MSHQDVSCLRHRLNYQWRLYLLQWGNSTDKKKAIFTKFGKLELSKFKLWISTLISMISCNWGGITNTYTNKNKKVTNWMSEFLFKIWGYHAIQKTHN